MVVNLQDGAANETDCPREYQTEHHWYGYIVNTYWRLGSFGVRVSIKIRKNLGGTKPYLEIPA